MITKKSPRLTFKALVETIRRVDADAAEQGGKPAGRIRKVKHRIVQTILKAPNALVGTKAVLKGWMELS